MRPLTVVALSLFSAGLALSAASGRADEPSSPPAPPPAPTSPPATPGEGNEPAPPPQRHMRRPGYVLADLVEKLGLSADQQKAIGAIIRSSQGQMQALRADESLSREDRRAKVREVLTSTRDQIRAALTPDQQKVFDAMPPPWARPRNPDGN